MTGIIPSATVRAPRTLNRIGRPYDVTAPKPITLGQRMTSRRLELRLTQSEVAKQVRFHPKSGHRRGSEAVLSRNAYCMYEIDGCEPGLLKLEAIAKALKIKPEWLAFGRGVRPKPC